MERIPVTVFAGAGSPVEGPCDAKAQQERRNGSPEFQGSQPTTTDPQLPPEAMSVSQFSHSFVLPSSAIQTTMDSEKSSNFYWTRKRNGKSLCANLEAEIHHLSCTRQRCSIHSWTSKLHKNASQASRSLHILIVLFGVNRN